MVAVEQKHFVSLQKEKKKNLLGISISVCLCCFAYQSLAGCGSGWAHLCQLLGKDKKWDKAGSSPGCMP